MPCNVLSVVRRRYTTKHYDTTRHISEEQLNALLEVLRLAPSSVNIQPWHFYVLRSDEARAKIIPAVKDFNLDRVRHADAVILFAIEKNVADEAWLDRLFEQEKADGRLPVDAKANEIDALRRTAVAAYCASPEKTERWTSEQVHIALGFGVLAAAQMGIDTTILGGLFFDQIDEIFGISDEGRKTVVGLAVGIADPADTNAHRPKSRLPHKTIISTL